VAPDDKPKRFWDGFQWVDTDVTITAQTAPLGQATRKDRRLYVGNLPVGSGITEKQLSEFISTSMKQRGIIAMDAPDPVLSVWLSPEGTYAFVEFHTVDHANAALGLNGIMLLMSALRVSRPNNYQPNIGVGTLDLSALTSTATPAAVPDVGQASLAPSASALVAAGTGLPLPVVPVAPQPAVKLTSTVLCCTNMLTKEDLMDKEEREGLKEDVMEECGKFGTVDRMKIPVAGNEACNLYIKWTTTEAAEKAIISLSSRKFDGRTVGVTSFPEDQFDALADGE